MSFSPRKIGKIARPAARIAELGSQVERLTKLVEQIQQTNTRQAAPFAKDAPKPDPKPPPVQPRR